MKTITTTIILATILIAPYPIFSQTTAMLETTDTFKMIVNRLDEGTLPADAPVVVKGQGVDVSWTPPSTFQPLAEQADPFSYGNRTGESYTITIQNDTSLYDQDDSPSKVISLEHLPAGEYEIQFIACKDNCSKPCDAVGFVLVQDRTPAPVANVQLQL